MKINFERIKYSPFGYKLFGSLIPTVVILTIMNILLALVLWASLCAGGMVYVYAAFFAVLLGCCVYAEYKIISQKLLQVRLLSDMTDGEHNDLVSDYNKYKENNRITLGCLASYGIILDDQICPWDIIKEIEFTPSREVKSHGRYGRHRRSYVISTTIKLHVVYGNRRRIIEQNILRYPTDLSEDIQRFKAMLPEYTDREIKINNRYYHTIF